ncbi:MAG TPA: Hsp20/alpha crystallin family protein [Fimbriiglobus sp.]|jgi:HSP20 family protein
MVRFLTREPFGEIWGEVNRISDEMNRLFGRKGAAQMPVNLWADEQNLYAEFDLPDVNPAELEVTVTEGTKLNISGERAAPEEGGAVWVRQERPYGAFTREVTLPMLVDADKVQAAYENGVLKLTLPKSEAAKPRKIVVNS